MFIKQSGFCLNIKDKMYKLGSLITPGSHGRIDRADNRTKFAHVANNLINLGQSH